jgi:hypothetical protein
MINIAMILVTDDPMEGVAFDVQDHARRIGIIWTGTHGEMISLNLHGVEEPTRRMLRPHQGAETGQWLIRVLHQRRRGHSIRGTLAKPDLGGMTPFSTERWPWKAQDTPILTMTSSSFMDIHGGRLGSSGTCGMLERPLGV